MSNINQIIKIEYLQMNKYFNKKLMNIFNIFNIIIKLNKLEKKN